MPPSDGGALSDGDWGFEKVRILHSTKLVFVEVFRPWGASAENLLEELRASATLTVAPTTSKVRAAFRPI